MSDKDLPITEELDFHYLLGLMPPLTGMKEFAWLPELFTIIGVTPFLELCKYAGGESITIPTLEELSDSLDALQWFYDVYIKQSKLPTGIPYRLISLVSRIQEVYDARDGTVDDSEPT